MTTVRAEGMDCRETINGFFAKTPFNPAEKGVASFLEELSRYSNAPGRLENVLNAYVRGDEMIVTYVVAKDDLERCCLSTVFKRNHSYLLVAQQYKPHELRFNLLVYGANYEKPAILGLRDNKSLREITQSFEKNPSALFSTAENNY